MSNLVAAFQHAVLYSILVVGYMPLAMAERPVAAVVVASVEEREMAPSMWVPGTVVSRNDAWISAEVLGRINRVAEVGDAVVSQAVLAQIDSRALQLTLQDNQANIKRLQASLAFSAKQLDRLEQLRKSDSASKTQFDAATTQREMVAQELVQARAVLDRTQYDLDRTTVRAPFGGRVAERELQTGEFAQIGARLLRLVDVENLEVRANAPIEVAPFVQPGEQVVVKAGKTYATGPLRAVVPIGDTVSRSVELRVSISSDVALVGAAVRVAVPTAPVQSLYAVPRDAIHLRSREQHVVVVKGNVARVVTVDPGIASEGWIAVDGLSAGELVVLRGGERLRDGQVVSVLTREGIEEPVSTTAEQ